MTDNLWMSFIADDPEQIILYCSSPDGNNWGSDYQLSSYWAPATFFQTPPAQNSPLAPASAFFNNQIFIAWTGSGDSQVVLCSAPAFSIGFWGQWPEQFLQNQAAAPEPPIEQTAIGQTSRFAPSLAVGNGQLWAGFVGNDEANENPVLLCSSSDGVNWSPNSFIHQFSQTAVAMATFGNRFYVAGISTDGDNAVLVSSVDFGQPWTGPKSIGHFSRFAPSLAVFGNQLYAAFVGLDNQLYVASTANGVNWTPGHTPVHQWSQAAPSLTVFNGRLYVAFVGTNANHPVLVCSTADGVNWSNYTATGQYSSLAPSLAVAPFVAIQALNELFINPPPPPEGGG